MVGERIPQTPGIKDHKFSFLNESGECHGVRRIGSDVSGRPRDAVADPAWGGNHLCIKVTGNDDRRPLGYRSDLSCQLVQEQLALLYVVRLGELVLPDTLVHTEEFDFLLLQRDLDT